MFSGHLSRCRPQEHRQKHFGDKQVCRLTLGVHTHQRPKVQKMQGSPSLPMASKCHKKCFLNKGVLCPKPP